MFLRPTALALSLAIIAAAVLPARITGTTTQDPAGADASALLPADSNIPSTGR
jgi:hypothetical protein